MPMVRREMRKQPRMVHSYNAFRDTRGQRRAHHEAKTQQSPGRTNEVRPSECSPRCQASNMSGTLKACHKAVLEIGYSGEGTPGL